MTSNAFYNKALLTDATLATETTKISFRSIKKKKIIKGDFLHIDYDVFNKNAQIKNATVRKFANDCKNKGPYFSYCPSCSRKNVEYVDGLNEEDAIKVLKFIKKTL